MTADGEYVAVVDRLEGDRAVLVLERDGDPVDDLVVEAGELPAAARRADAVLVVELADGDLTRVRYDPKATRERSRDAQDRFDRLARRPPEDDEG